MEQNPLAKYELRRIGGSARNTEGMFTNINGNAARDARRAAKRDARPMTYAEMQDQGIARPAPPMASPVDNLGTMFVGDQMASTMDGTRPVAPPAYIPPGSPGATRGASPTVGGPVVTPGTATTTTTTGGGTTSTTPTGLPFDLGNLPRFDPYVYSNLRSAALDNLRAQFTSQQKALEEDLARRGLSASSVGAESLVDLTGQQNRALATLEADLLAREDERQRSFLDLYLKMLPYLAAGRSNNG